jgi:3-hydroxyisobutyrate dehydrogenase-like beta-hydroxyacid dehydrogenase
MGLPMATRLVAEQFEVAVHDIDEGRMYRVHGAAAAPNAAAAADGRDLVIVMTATEEQCRSALFGPEGVIRAESKPAAVAITATVGIEAVVSMAEQLAAGGIETIDTPVSGGVARAQSGELLLMVGASTELLEHHSSVLGALAANVAHCGTKPGDGQAVKLINQLLCGVHIVAAAEALGLATAMGLDRKQVWETIRGGAAASFMLDDRGSRMLAEPEDRELKSAISIFVKDLGLVTDVADSRNYPAFVAESAQGVFSAAAAMDLECTDDSSLVDFYDSHRLDPN